jgi:hypothetical protein
MQKTVTFQPSEFVQAVSDLYRDVQTNPQKYGTVYYLKTQDINGRQVTSCFLYQVYGNAEKWTDKMIEAGIQSAQRYVDEHPDSVFNLTYFEYGSTTVHIHHENEYTRRVDKAITESYRKYPNRD